MKIAALMTSILLLGSLSVAAAPSKNAWKPDGKPSANWDDREYDWWQHNCLDLSIGDARISLNNCGAYDKKYRDHYNRSVNSGNNPGKGHDKGNKKH